MPQCTENPEVSQEVPVNGTDPRKAIREKVARALCKEAGEDPDGRGLADAPNWSWFLEPADAAIAAHLEALSTEFFVSQVSAGGKAIHSAMPDKSIARCEHAAILAWQAMVCGLAALRSPKTGGESHE